MKLENRLGLPEAFVRAVKAFDDEYDNEGSYFTASSAEEPARVRILKAKHRDELVEDASDRVWTTGGTAWHKVLEASARPEDLVERRFAYYFGFTDPPTKISAKIDLYEPDLKRLTNWKETSAWTLLHKDRLPEWEAQMNVEALLLRHHEHPVESIQIVARLRDWSWAEVQRSQDYPKQAIAVVPLTLWPREKAERYICDRIMAYRKAEAAPVIPDCTPEERWAKPTTWAVHKPGRKSALKVCDTKADAESISANAAGTYVVERPGESVRCARYCIVGKETGFCSQWEAERQRLSAAKTEAA